MKEHPVGPSKARIQYRQKKKAIPDTRWALFFPMFVIHGAPLLRTSMTVGGSSSDSTPSLCASSAISCWRT